MQARPIALALVLIAAAAVAWFPPETLPSLGPGAGVSSPAPPKIVQSRIPFPAKRKAEMRRYARRHYGLDTYLLRRPKVIVEHFTGTSSYEAAYRTFAPDRPDPELHELPGVCAHFIIDRDGVIHQLVPLGLMCRHTVGLNWTAIGIEHVGTSDAGVVTNRRQLSASLALTRWLQSRFGIRTRNVIGHSESLRSPYHHERVPALKHQTHADFSHATMRRYRRSLQRRGTGTALSAQSRVLHPGRSVRGRPIDAVLRGDPAGQRKILVVGAIHGDEQAGISIVRALERAAVPPSAQLILVETVNPDGVAAGIRQNARGVDLNRNFPWGWRPAAGGGSLMYPGPRPLSEPETRVARRLVRVLRPAITIWFHQHLRLVDRSGGDVRIERRFARLAHLPLRKIRPYPGTATRWQNHSFPSSTAFVVELPAGRLTAPQRARFTRAVLALSG